MEIPQTLNDQNVKLNDLASGHQDLDHSVYHIGNFGHLGGTN